MVKTFRVTAHYTQYLSTEINVPDDWNEERLMQFYKDHGATGEFEEDPDNCDWTWGGAEQIAFIPDNPIKPDKKFFEEEEEEDDWNEQRDGCSLTLFQNESPTKEY